MRSLRPWTTERFSLSEVAPGMCSSMRTIPTNMRDFPLGGLCQGPGRLLELVRLDDVAGLEVVHAVERDAALEAAADLLDVVLEAPQRVDASRPLRRAVAEQPHLGGPRNGAARHHAARDGGALGELEDLTHFGRPQYDFLDLRLQQALERLLHVLDGLVDDVVQPDLDVLARGQLARAGIGPHVEAHDDGARS